MKIHNPQANPNSKTQKAKAEYLKQHPIEVLSCKKCGVQSGQRFVTLHKDTKGEGYFCTSCNT